METKVEKIINEEKEWKAIETAGQIIRDGGLVAFPTETVYGLGGDALQAESSKKIYQAKGRPSDNPLIVHIAEYSDMEKITARLPKEAKLLADAFWPGPLTMILEKNDRVPYETTGGMETVAIRMPDHPLALALIRQSGGYIAAPSANTSGRPSPTKAEHVYEDLNGKIQMILDGGPVGIGIESTIVDLTEEVPMILRPGYITQEMLLQVLPEVKMDPGIIASDSKQKPKAPGMKYRHYAPKADLTIISGLQDNVFARINELAMADIRQGLSVGIIATDESIARYERGKVLSIGERCDEESIARHLYGILREFDELKVDRIYSESFEAPGMGSAIMNRLLKAAGHKVIMV